MRILKEISNKIVRQVVFYPVIISQLINENVRGEWLAHRVGQAPADLSMNGVVTVHSVITDFFYIDGIINVVSTAVIAVHIDFTVFR